MQRSICNICRQIYVPVEENLDENLPDGWACKVCNATREDFQQLTEAPDANLESRLCPFQY